MEAVSVLCKDPAKAALCRPDRARTYEPAHAARGLTFTCRSAGSHAGMVSLSPS